MLKPLAVAMRNGVAGEHMSTRDLRRKHGQTSNEQAPVSTPQHVTTTRIIFLIGAPRSGTTLLGRGLAKSPDCVYIEEPMGAWLRGFRHRRSDMSFGIADRSFLETYFRERAKPDKVIVEKTPTNILRVRDIHSVFPDARYVFISRRPLEVADSVIRKWRRGQDRNYERFGEAGGSWLIDLRNRVKRAGDLGLAGVIAQRHRVFEALRRQLGLYGRELGLRLPGSSELIQRMGDNDYALLSWIQAYMFLLADSHEIPEHNQIWLDYEDIMTCTERVAQLFKESMGLSPDFENLEPTAAKRIDEGPYNSELVNVANILYERLKGKSKVRDSGQDG
jgi:hypothetical protein